MVNACQRYSLKVFSHPNNIFIILRETFHETILIWRGFCHPNLKIVPLFANIIINEGLTHEYQTENISINDGIRARKPS